MWRALTREGLWCFFYFSLPSTPSAVNKRDSTASLLLWLSPTWVDFHVSERGGQIAETKDSLSKCSHQVKSGIEHIVVWQPWYWNQKVTRPVVNRIISWIGLSSRTPQVKWKVEKHSTFLVSESNGRDGKNVSKKDTLFPSGNVESPLTSQYNSAHWYTFHTHKIQSVEFERPVISPTTR